MISIRTRQFFSTSRPTSVRLYSLQESGLYLYCNHDHTGGHFNLPKLEKLYHYVDGIRNFGATDNYNTEAAEHFHIDFAKTVFCASNKRNYLPQIAIWLERRKKLVAFQARVLWRIEGRDAIHCGRPCTSMVMTKAKAAGTHIIVPASPSLVAVPLTMLATHYGATSIKVTLQTFIAQHCAPSQALRYRSLQADKNIIIPFESVLVWHKIKFRLNSLLLAQLPDEDNSVNANPGHRDLPHLRRFDTALVKLPDGNGADTDSTTGIKSRSSKSPGS